jgi:hypothetical protein
MSYNQGVENSPKMAKNIRLKNKGGVLMGKASKSKGARGELLFRNECHKAGFENVQRGGQLPFQKGNTLADVIGLFGCHLEIKFQEKLNIRQAVEQAAGDCQNGQYPVLAHKTARKDWLITMRAADWFNLYRAWLENQPADKVGESLTAESLQLFAKNVFCWRKAGYP